MLYEVITSKNSTARIIITPPTAPIIKEPFAETSLHPAVIATNPAKQPFNVKLTSGLPYFNQLYNILDTVAIAPANIVLTSYNFV